MEGKLIKEIRKNLFMTQLEFSNQLNVGITSVQKWEWNIMKPSLKHQKKIIELCNINNIDIEKIKSDIKNN